MKRPLALLLLALSSPSRSAADSTAPAPCANACYNYLSQLASQAASSGNAAIQTLQGTVTPAQVVAMCAAAKPLDCCACGAPGTPAVDVLDAWTLACATLAAAGDDGTLAAACFDSGGRTSCTDYGGLLEGANCTMPVLSAAGGNASAAGNVSATATATAGTNGATHTPNAAVVVLSGAGFLGWASLGVAVWMVGVA
jgi:hypothetical protein